MHSSQSWARSQFFGAGLSKCWNTSKRWSSWAPIEDCFLVRKLEDLGTFTWFMMIFRFNPIYLLKIMVLHSHIKLPEGIWSHLSKCGYAGFQLLHQNKAKTSSPMVLNGIKLLATWSSKDGRLEAPGLLSLTGDGHLIAWFLTLATINDSFCWENLQETGWFLPIVVSKKCSLALIQWNYLYTYIYILKLYIYIHL